MKIAVIGMGAVGGTLGRRWAEGGHAVLFGAKDPNDADGKALLAKIKGKASLASVPDAVKDADVVVLAIPGEVAADVLAIAGDLTGKILIDCTNPVGGKVGNLTLGPELSGGEAVAKLAKGARVYKTLHQTGWENLSDPHYPGGKLVMFVAGEEPAGKTVVLSLVSELGFDAIDVGDLSAARMLEPFARLWVHLAMRRKLGRQIAFALMHKA
jgi:8-hydroxy-5-deazaflavin:NADPH oxidoreductase